AGRPQPGARCFDRHAVGHPDPVLGGHRHARRGPVGGSMLHPYVVMLAQPGLATQVVEQVLSASDVKVVDLMTAAAAQDTPAVVCMVEGDHEELWDRARELGMPVVLVTNGELEAVGIVDAVLRGADAIVHLDSETADVLEAIDIVATGGTLLTPADGAVVESARMRLDNRQVITLTPREIDILDGFVALDRRGHGTRCSSGQGSSVAKS